MSFWGDLQRQKKGIENLGEILTKEPYKKPLMKRDQVGKEKRPRTETTGHEPELYQIGPLLLGLCPAAKELCLPLLLAPL